MEAPSLSLLLLGFIGTSIATRIIWSIIYNVYLHPLVRFPGSSLWASTSLFRHLNNTQGLMERKLLHMHQKFGPVVRYGPNALSFSSGAAWDDIFGYGSRPGRQQLRKVTTRPQGVAPGIINADDEDHSRLRGALVYAFSDRNIRASHGILQRHVGQLMQTITNAACEQRVLDFTEVLDDFMLSLIDEWGWTHERPNAAQRPHLEEASYTIFTFMALVPSIRMRETFPLVGRLMRHILLPAARDRGRTELIKWAQRIVTYCLQNRKSVERFDFVDAMLNGNDKHRVSTPEMITTTAMMIVAGTETTSTALTGIIYWLISTPHAYEKLIAEIRNAFADEQDIKPGATLNDLPYLKACINEGLRMYPPSPSSLSRITSPTHEISIAGHLVAKNTVVGVHQKAAYMLEENFHRAAEFLPERWGELEPDSPFVSDDRLVFQPFSYGPRDCLGRSMAYLTMRVVIARIFYSFDLDLANTTDRTPWMEQKIFQVWEKKPLVCHIHTI